MDFGIQRHWRNIWISVGSIKLFIFLCQRKTQKLNLQTGIKTFSVPLVFYADTEAVNLKPDICRQITDNSYTLNKETQIPCAIGFCAVDKKGGSDYYGFEGKKCIEEIFRWLRKNAKSISVRKQKHRRLIISDEELKQMIDQGTRCAICKKTLNNEKAIHRDHFTDEIYGVAQNSCNYKLHTQTFTPIFSTTYVNMTHIIF